MPVVMPSVDDLVSEANEDINAWHQQNQSLRSEIDQLQRLVRDLTKNVDTLEEECQAPPLIPIKKDPKVRLSLGNTKSMATKWESQSVEEEEEEREEIQTSSSKSSGLNRNG